MNYDGALPPSGSSTGAATMTVALEDLLSQPAKIFFVLAFQGGARRTKSERKDLLAFASAV